MSPSCMVRHREDSSVDKALAMQAWVMESGYLEPTYGVRDPFLFVLLSLVNKETALAYIY